MYINNIYIYIYTYIYIQHFTQITNNYIACVQNNQHKSTFIWLNYHNSRNIPHCFPQLPLAHPPHPISSHRAKRHGPEGRRNSAEGTCENNGTHVYCSNNETQKFNNRNIIAVHP